MIIQMIVMYLMKNKLKIMIISNNKIISNKLMTIKMNKLNNHKPKNKKKLEEGLRQTKPGLRADKVENRNQKKGFKKK